MSEILKSGDWPIRSELQRSALGLRINIRMHPAIEQYMRQAMGTDEPIIEPVEAYGRNWLLPKGDDAKPLLVYGIPKELSGVFDAGRDVMYRMDRPGEGIVLGGGNNRPAQPAPRHLGDGVFQTSPAESSGTLNLSFLRLVGTSSDEGVTFYIGGIFTEVLIDEIERKVGVAVKEIYSQFMKPIRIVIEHRVREDVAERERVVEVAPQGGEDVVAA